MSNQDIKQIDHLIDGEFVPGPSRTPRHDPGRLSEVVEEIADGTPEIADRAVRAAAVAFETWSSTSVQVRSETVKKAAGLLLESIDLAELLAREHGGTLGEARTDFHLGAGVLEHTASLGPEFFKPRRSDDDQCTIEIERTPIGVIAAIVPWNMPIVLTMMKLAPALVAGNTVVLKPSPFASGALTLALAKLAELFPKGVINVVHGDGEVGAALTGHDLVRKIAFTGGTETAKHVMGAAAESIKNITLELGGNDPAVILPDARIDQILDRLLSGVYTRTGQICFAVKRIYVPRSMAEELFDAICSRLRDYQVGHGLREGVDFGPMNNKAQFDKVTDLIEKTRASGAEVVELGQKMDESEWGDGYYLLPHVVRNAAHDSLVASCEQFGPIIPLISYDDVDQAIAWANDSEYGLGSSVWTSDPERGFEVARRIESGSTFINSHAFDSLDLRMPFGGIKHSGLGREFGEAGLRSYVEEHAIRLLK